MYSSFSVYSITMPSDIRTNKCNFKAASQVKQSRITSDILDRLEEMDISICNIAIEKMQIQVELLDLCLQEAVDSLKPHINYTDSMIPMFENHHSVY